MSRLDDELRRALKREEPTPDFTERVMRRIAAAPAPRAMKNWWSELLSLFQTPRLRWVAIGVAVSLVVIVFASQRWRSAPLLDQPAAADLRTTPPSSTGSSPGQQKPDFVTPVQKPETGGETIAKNGGHKRISRLPKVAKQEKAKPSEGELAKEQLMLALHIASASLNEAQRLVDADK